MRKVDFLPKKFGNIVIAENRQDVQVCRDSGLPFLFWSGTDAELGILVFRRALMKRFPYVKWDHLFADRIGRKRFRTLILAEQGCKAGEFEEFADDGKVIDATAPVSDVAGECREFNCKDSRRYKAMEIAQAACDDFTVDINVLQKLRLMPTFLGDIASAVRVNLASALWQEGWTKKLHAPMGNIQGSGEQRNLLIIDISASIPVGISATLLALMDTMKEQARADLIVTGSQSMYWRYDEVHPSIGVIRRIIGRCNESSMFNNILIRNIAGREWGNVIAFGDNDTPKYCDSAMSALADTKVGKFWHYHTGIRCYGSNRPCGYAKWQDYVVTQEEPAFDTSWCTCIDDTR